ncbi:MAG: hypothetical protein JWO86_2346 [Myxococcaceae bacterium]|nr:hypothetical protein [Myxococcaceae bacterium]
MRRGLAIVAAAALTAAVACTSTADEKIPATAPPSRHAAMREALTTDARGLSFADGDWLEDLGDAPFYGLAWLSRRAADGPLPAEDAARLDASLARARTLLASDLLSGDLQEKVMAALGVIEHVAAVHDRGDSPDVVSVDAFLDRLDHLVMGFGDYLAGVEDSSWAVRTYGPTAVTALVAIVHAQYALYIDNAFTHDHLDRAISIEQTITNRALTDLSDAASGRSARAYATGPDRAGIDLYPNVSMILLEARLFRLTKNETYRLQARALYGAIQPLKLEDVPTRYASPYAAVTLNAKTRDVATLSSQNYLALALMVLFEITGDTKFSDEADRVLDAIETMRGPWCLAQVHTEKCAPACATGQACVTTSCTADRCTTGLLHHEVDGRLANATDPVLFCSGCNLQALYVIGYRRALAGEPF